MFEHQFCVYVAAPPLDCLCRPECTGNAQKWDGGSAFLKAHSAYLVLSLAWVHASNCASIFSTLKRLSSQLPADRLRSDFEQLLLQQI